jgi:hypothetical protein
VPGAGAGGSTCTIAITDDLGDTATSPDVTIAPASGGALSLLTLDPGLVGQSTAGSGDTRAYSMWANGTFTGSTPTSVTSASWTGCGGGAATVTGFHTNIYPAGTYGANTFTVGVNAPSTAGSCTLTVTTNLGDTATSPATTVSNPTGNPDVVFNVHNAPGWIHSHSYTVASGPHTRVVNGAGWTESTGVWNPGSALNAYELRSDSTSPCTTAGSVGPSGTGSSISDGTCTWKYLSAVDYVTFTGFYLDGPPWSAKTYVYGEQITTNVSNNLRAYALESAGGVSANALAFCTSTVAPSGVGGGSVGWAQGLITTADGCVWAYVGDVVYSSQTATIPYNTFTNAASFPTRTSHLSRNYTAKLWNDREYLAGTNGEFPGYLLFADHQMGGHCCGGETSYAGCVGASWSTDCPLITIEPATGEGFGNTITPSVPLTGYDATKGVALRSAASGLSPGLIIGDFSIKINGLQIKSEHSVGLWAFNFVTVMNNIIDGGWTGAGGDDPSGSALSLDVPDLIANNLIFTHGTQGIAVKYGSFFVLNNTIVNLGSMANVAAINFSWTWTWFAPVIANNAIYGFPHGGAYLTGETAPHDFDASSATNVTDTTGPDTGTANWVGGDVNNAMTVITIPGTTYNTSGASMFVSPGSDWRPGAALIGAGAGYGTFGWGCAASFSGGCVQSSHNFDTPDFLGTTRPQAGSWTVGAEQHP